MINLNKIKNDIFIFRDHLCTVNKGKSTYSQKNNIYTAI
jgi:hypothetical protein